MDDAPPTPALSGVLSPPLERVLEQLAAKWNVPVLLALAQGPRRFNALLTTVPGISHRLLAVTLVRLEQASLVQRKVRARRPPAVEYRLSGAGCDLVDLLADIERWARSRTTPT
jgi:DNA-binding HxlR family transcriptional regulator